MNNAIGLMLLAALVSLTVLTTQDSSGEAEDFIVWGHDSATLNAALNEVGAQASRELSVIRGVAVSLNPQQKAALAQHLPQLKIHPDAKVQSSGLLSQLLTTVELDPDDGLVLWQPKETWYPRWIDADRLHNEGILGSGVGIAVLDTGIWKNNGLDFGTHLRPNRVVAEYSALEDDQDPHDGSGHGTHLSSVMASSFTTPDGYYQGVAPDADLINVKAFHEDGSATYADVIAALDWIIDHREQYNIRVVNLSFSASPQSWYWEDPLNVAVMTAWQSGIVVVASAGNAGPTPMTIGVPGNVPYVVTVGSADDNYTPDDLTDDFLSAFSSVGPTFEGFVKPDLLAPGGHMMGHMPSQAHIIDGHEQYLLEDNRHFKMSGTSQSAAVISGITALMLQLDPTLSPDDVKCRLADSARTAMNGDDAMYSIFQQGAGLVNAYDAVYSDATDCANRGLDIAKDLSGDEHYAGPVQEDENGNFVIRDENGEPSELDGDAYLWSRSYVWSRSYLWSRSYVWSRSYIWSRSYVWSRAYLWSRGYDWDTGTDSSSTIDEPSSSGLLTDLVNALLNPLETDLNALTGSSGLLNLGIEPFEWVEPESQRYQDD